MDKIEMFFDTYTVAIIEKLDQVSFKHLLKNSLELK